MIKLDGAKFICEMRPGDRLLVWKGKVILCNPEHKPVYVTEAGFLPIDSWHPAVRTMEDKNG